MYNTPNTIVRSNQNGVMFRFTNPVSVLYAIYDVREQRYSYAGTLNACKKAWNRHYRNSRQFVTPNGVNHRYLVMAS